MVKFDNYVFFNLCEHSLKIYKGTHYSNYRSFCHNFKSIIMLDNFSGIDRQRLYEMCGYLMLIFNFDVDEAIRYIGRYFLEEKFVIFELPTRNIKEFFPKSFN